MQRRTIRKRQIYAWNSLRFLRRHLMVLCSVGLFSLSFYFWFEVQKFRKSIARTDADAFSSGDIVTIKIVRDGDEVVVTKGDKQALVRLLGIQSFDPKVNDPVVAGIGKSCFTYLRNNYEQRRAQIMLGKVKLDGKGRLLAYLSVQEKPGASYNFDVGEDLLRRGMTQVYLRYDFEREPSYLSIESMAESQRQGIWGSQGASDRANALKKQWVRAKERVRP